MSELPKVNKTGGRGTTKREGLSRRTLAVASAAVLGLSLGAGVSAQEAPRPTVQDESSVVLQSPLLLTQTQGVAATDLQHRSHYSHSSHASHVSHQSHYSHYSSSY